MTLMLNSAVLFSFKIHLILRFEHDLLWWLQILHKTLKSHIEDRAEGLWPVRGLDQAPLLPGTLVGEVSVLQFPPV